jgi:hypothetical protein
VVLKKRRLLGDRIAHALAVASATAVFADGTTAQISFSVSGWCS